MLIDVQKLRGAACVLALFLAACDVETDRTRYEVGESGVATFRNELRATLFLGGCAHFDYEKRVGGDWISQGPDIQCFWEGTAQPVPPGSEVVDPIHAREPGLWRLRYPVGVGCSAKRPLSQCTRIIEITSNAFEVAASRCVRAGCSSELCVEAGFGNTIATPCEWRPEYECLRDARCGRFGPGGSCAFEPTPELAACLETAAG